MKVKSTKNLEMFRVKALIYGMSGVGKTFSASTLDPKKTLILSAESGLLSLRGRDIDVWEIETWVDLMEAYKQLILPENTEKYDTIFIDSLTEIDEIAKEQIVKQDRPNLKGKDIGKIYDDMMTQQDYGLLATRMTRFIRAYRDLDYNIIFTALELDKKNDITGAVKLVPSISGRLSLNLSGYFDEVFHMITKKEIDNKVGRYFITANIESTIAKDVSGALDLMELPDWNAIFKKIKTSKIKEEK